MDTSYKLYASSDSLNGVNRQINEWLATEVILVPMGVNLWGVTNRNGIIDGWRVIKKGKRYRFEILQKPIVY